MNNTKENGATNRKKWPECKNIKSVGKAMGNAQFPESVTVEKAKELLKNQDVDNIQYVQQVLRINAVHFQRAYLSMPNDEPDLIINGIRDRNCALEGDLVVASLKPESDWIHLPDGGIQKTGIIICIVEKVHHRRAIGHLKVNAKNIRFYPRDVRIPILKIYNQDLQKTFQNQPDLNLEHTLFVCNLVRWDKPASAIGKIVSCLGKAEDINTWVNGILISHNLDVTPYSDDLTKELPNSDYVPTIADMHNREDWRNECVFTIDPAAAVDLDDAVSCRILDNGNYEVGVHISDLTHYLEFSSPLDQEVAKRATTVYLADNVYHMLPKQLCELCSLQSGCDKLAFSVIWEITPEADIVKYRFAKTIINSCCQLAYEQAQCFIEKPEEKYSEDFVKVYGEYTIADLSSTVNMLFRLSTILRNKRFDEGALTLSTPKLRMHIDKDSGLPISYDIDAQQDSNRLIEEFMLLANITVATHLYENMPEIALLRKHKKPIKRILNATREILQNFGIHLDTETSATLQASCTEYEPITNNPTDVTVIQAKYNMILISTLCSKAMKSAQYKCAANSTFDDLRHYALNVPLYTHFTSPIRRYADCIVHRLLYASLQNKPLPARWSPQLFSQIAATCNQKKCSAMLAAKRSHELYFAYFVHLVGNVIVPAIVMDVRKQQIEVIHCDSGINLKLSFQDIKQKVNVKFTEEGLIRTITIVWKDPPVTQVINMFSILRIELKKTPRSFSLHGTLLPPETNT